MKDLQGHSTVAYSFDDDSENMTQLQQQQQPPSPPPQPQYPLLQQQRPERAKPISDDMTEGNLFDCCGQNRQQANNFINYCKNNNPHQSINKPTDGTGRNIINYYERRSRNLQMAASDEIYDDYEENEAAAFHDYENEVDVDDVDDDYKYDDYDNDDHDNHHQLRQQRLNKQQQQQCYQFRQDQFQQAAHQIRSRPNVAASLPIQVPARRTRKDFYSMKLSMMKVEESAGTDESTISSTGTQDSEDFSPVRRGDRNRPAIENMPAFLDDDAFLGREFNENHYNHYLLDGLDDEHLTAEEDPMRLFASIQALAKSLHEDAELFGSLPPKRMFESPGLWTKA